MKTFAAIITTGPNYVERRQPYREAHLERLRRLKEEGKLMMGGAWADPVDGALVIYRGETLADVRQLIEEDPYYRAGLWPDVSVREWNIAI